ncbi:FmdB family zinc ribbon protein [Chloroflexota bacterium]
MPIYEYECGLCHHQFEQKQSFNEESLVTCPVCPGNIHRLIQPAPVIFKGSGFYVTDSRKESTADKSGGDTPSKSEPKKE